MKDRHLDAILETMSYCWNSHLDEVHGTTASRLEQEALEHSCETCRRLREATYALLHLEGRKKVS